MKSSLLFVLTSIVSLATALPASPELIADMPVPDSTVVPLAGSTENGLSGPCKDVTVIYARGTFEIGNVGTTAGPPVFALLRSALGDDAVAIQGVDYPADLAGYLEGGDPGGSVTMANLVNQAASKCPNTKIVIGGYSQGGQLVHNAAARLSSSVTSRIAAAWIFGDPDNGRPVGSIPSSKVLSDCHLLDIVCTGVGDFTTHLTYEADAGMVSTFIVAHVR